MSEELGAVLDAPEVNADEVVDQGLEGTPDDVVDPAAVVDAKEEPVDWRTVPPELKDFFRSPAGKKARDAWFERKAWNEKFPEGGFKKADEIISFLDEHGGREGLTTALGELQGKAAELDAISEKIQNGDASLVNDLTPETLSKLAPVVAERWAKDDPEGWGAAMSGVMAATINQNGIPMFLERMGLMLEVGKTDAIPAMIKQLQEWAGSFQAKAQAPRTTQTTQQPDKFAAREQELNSREQKAFESDVEKEVESFRTTQISKELESFFKRRPNDNDAKDLAISTVRNEVLTRLHNDQTFKTSVQALLARKDKAGAAKLIKSRETSAITEIAPKVGRTIFGNPGPAQPAAQKPAGVPSKVDAGFSFIDKAPKPELIDRFRTTDAMIMRGKFILKDGRKLTLEG